ncbi:fungal-specific transcription factor domain-containing protein [Gaertneriomyces semiglobifer]|nr:fungal-specific transcription factor domain-containing protein [Gaertneriomyces semiglobifer]
MRHTSRAVYSPYLVADWISNVEAVEMDMEHSEGRQLSDSPPLSSGSQNGNDKNNKRKRTTKACDICNKRKVKCDSKHPACSQCANAGLPCTYTREAKKRGPKQGHLKELESRLKQMEALIKPLADKIPEGSGAPSPTTHASSPPISNPTHVMQRSTQPVASNPQGPAMFPPHTHAVNPAMPYGQPPQPMGVHGQMLNMPPPNAINVPHMSHVAEMPNVPVYTQFSPQYHAQYQHYPQYAPYPMTARAPSQSTSPHAGVPPQPSPPNSNLTGNPYLNGLAFGSNPNAAMPSLDASTGLSPALSIKGSPAIPRQETSPRTSEDEDIWNIIDRDFDELMGGGGSWSLEKPLESSTDPFSSLWDLPDGAGPGLGNTKSTRSIPRQLQVPFGEIPLAQPSAPGKMKEWPSEDEIPQEAIDELLDIFFLYANPILGHMIHETEFRNSLPTQSPLLLHAMYSVAARWSKHPSIMKEPDLMYQAGDVFYSKARVLISNCVDTPSLDNIAGLIMLMTYASGSGRASASWMYSGMAIRMAQSLKLDLDPDFPEVQETFGKISFYEKERRRRLWWCCFLMDRYSAAAADRAMLCQERDVRVFSPVSVVQWRQMSENDVEPTGDVPGSHNQWQLAMLHSAGTLSPISTPDTYQSNNPLDHYIALGKIFGRVMEYADLLKSPVASLPGTQVISMGEAEIRATRIEAALRDWMAGLPPWMRNPGRTFAANWTETNEDGALTPPPWEVAYLHLFYHTSVVLLHRPKMMTVLQQGPQAAMRSPHFIASQNSAINVATLLEIIMSSNPEMHWLSPFVCFCIFQTALVHVVSAQTARTDSTQCEAACQRVRTHLRALRITSRFWLQGGKLAGILADLFSNVERNVLRQGVEPSSSDSNSSALITTGREDKDLVASGGGSTSGGEGTMTKGQQRYYRKSQWVIQ